MRKEWLSLSKREQKGFLVLTVILFLLLLFYTTIPYLFSDPGTDVETDSTLNTWGDSLNTAKGGSGNKLTDTLFFFDPNSASIYDLEALGIRGTPLINWLKYREGRRRFEVPGDLYKVYGLDSILVQLLLPYVNFSEEDKEIAGGYDFARKPDNRSAEIDLNTSNPLVMKTFGLSELAIDSILKWRSTHWFRYLHTAAYNDSLEAIMLSGHDKGNLMVKRATKMADSGFVIEINRADTAEFALLSGIGPVLSKRIVDYRFALGGFYSIDQLTEVYGMPPTVVERNRDCLTVDPTTIKRLDLNRCSLRQLKNHPYIGFYLARDIVEYKKKCGSIQKVDELYAIKAVDATLFEKLSAYLETK